MVPLGRDDGNVGNKHDYTPPFFRQEELEREDWASTKTRCCVMYLLSTSLGCLGAAMMKRQHKIFGRGGKSRVRHRVRPKKGKEMKKTSEKREWVEGGVEA